MNPITETRKNSKLYSNPVPEIRKKLKIIFGHKIQNLKKKRNRF